MGNLNCVCMSGEVLTDAKTKTNGDGTHNTTFWLLYRFIKNVPGGQEEVEEPFPVFSSNRNVYKQADDIRKGALLVVQGSLKPIYKVSNNGTQETRVVIDCWKTDVVKKAPVPETEVMAPVGVHEEEPEYEHYEYDERADEEFYQGDEY